MTNPADPNDPVVAAAILWAQRPHRPGAPTRTT